MNKHLTHPQIHCDYYEWLKNLDVWTKSFFIERASGATDEERFQNFHGIAMAVWSMSREIAAEQIKKDSIE